MHRGLDPTPLRCRPGLARSRRDGPTERDRLLARRDQGVRGGYGVGRERSGSQTSGHDVSRGMDLKHLIRGAALQRDYLVLALVGHYRDSLTIGLSFT